MLVAIRAYALSFPYNLDYDAYFEPNNFWKELASTLKVESSHE